MCPLCVFSLVMLKHVKTQFDRQKEEAFSFFRCYFRSKDSPTVPKEFGGQITGMNLCNSQCKYGHRSLKIFTQLKTKLKVL